MPKSQLHRFEKRKPDDTELSLIDLVLKLPYDAWTFYTTSIANNFYVIYKDATYRLYVSDGHLTHFKVAINDESFEVPVTNELKLYVTRLFDDVKKTADKKREQAITKSVLLLSAFVDSKTNQSH